MKLSDLVADISAFENADRGTLVIGIHDKSRKVEGINRFGKEKIFHAFNQLFYHAYYYVKKFLQSFIALKGIS